MKKTSKLTSIMLAGSMVCMYAFTACKSTEETKTLAEPQSITYTDGTLGWAAVESATAYEVVVYQGATSEIALEKQTVTETSVSVASLTIGNYTAGITATAEGYKSSNEKKYTFEVKAAPEKLATPDGFACENGKSSRRGWIYRKSYRKSNGYGENRKDGYGGFDIGGRFRSGKLYAFGKGERR